MGLKYLEENNYIPQSSLANDGYDHIGRSTTQLPNSPINPGEGHLAPGASVDSSLWGGTSGNFFNEESGAGNAMAGLGIVNSLAGLIGGFQNHRAAMSGHRSNMKSAKQARRYASQDQNEQMARARHNFGASGLNFDPSRNQA